MSRIAPGIIFLVAALIFVLPGDALAGRTKIVSPLANYKVSLRQAIGTAESKAGGKATDAAISTDGTPKITVHVFKKDGTTVTVEIDGKTGKVILPPVADQPAQPDAN